MVATFRSDNQHRPRMAQRLQRCKTHIQQSPSLLRYQGDAAMLTAHKKITPPCRGVGRLMATLRCDRWAVGFCRSLAFKNPGCLQSEERKKKQKREKTEAEN